MNVCLDLYLQSVRAIEANLESRSQEQVHDLTAEKERLLKEWAEMRSVLETERAQNIEARQQAASDMREQRSRLEVAFEAERKWEATAAGLQAKVDAFHVQLDELKEQLRSTRNALEERSNSTNAQGTDVAGGGTTSGAQLSDARLQLAVASADLAASREEVAAKAAQVAQYQSIAASHEEALITLQKNIAVVAAQTKQEAATAAETIESLTRQVASAKERLQDVEAQTSLSAQQIMELEDKQSTSERDHVAQVARLTAQVSAAEVQLEAMRKDVDIHSKSRAEAQANFEVELSRHSKAVTALTQVCSNNKVWSEHTSSFFYSPFRQSKNWILL